MKLRVPSFFVVLLALVSSFVAVAQPPILQMDLVTDGLSSPVGIVDAGDGSGRLFVLEQGVELVPGESTGRIRVVENGNLLATPFLTLSPLANGDEQGLLGLAFHPSYASNGFFYVNYTRANGDTIISRFQVSAGNANVADASSEMVMMTIVQPFSNHNGGHLAFGPDGYLYIALGDGGSANDPGNRAQNLTLRLGKILRIDVDGAVPFAIPMDNPFVGTANALDEIWSYGLRNPWRFSFDRSTGDLLIGDVGQGSIEEVNFQPAASGGGENWGWRCYEGNNPFNTAGCGPLGDYDFPILSYTHVGGRCSITGGFRYRGPWPSLAGYYVYGDFCTGQIWGATSPDDIVWTNVELLNSSLLITSFGEDSNGELYVADRGGSIYRVVGVQEVLLDGFESGDCAAWSSTVGGC